MRQSRRKAGAALGAFSLAVTVGVAMLSAAGTRLPLGLDLYRPVPEANALTPEKVALGRRLFHDRRLSSNGSMSCATCHDPGRAFGDSRPVAVGVDGARGRRNVPAIINRAWGRSFFWDGRAATLEEQALHPIVNPLELGARPDAVVALARGSQYRTDFRRAFGSGEPSLGEVTRALSSYVRTIVSGDSPYDRFTFGRPSALDVPARRGLGLFLGRAGCASCHSGPTFSDEQFHNTGVAWLSSAGSTASPRGEFTDLGRAGVTGRDEDRGAFKTPTLREVERTAPYMHDGSLLTLEAVVHYYDRGGRQNPALDPRIRHLRLTTVEQADLVAFLRSLTGRVTDGQ